MTQLEEHFIGWNNYIQSSKGIITLSWTYKIYNLLNISYCHYRTSNLLTFRLVLLLFPTYQWLRPGQPNNINTIIKKSLMHINLFFSLEQLCSNILYTCMFPEIVSRSLNISWSGRVPMVFLKVVWARSLVLWCAFSTFAIEMVALLTR